MGIEDVKFTAINMYKYKEGLRFFANVGRVALIVFTIRFTCRCHFLLQAVEKKEQA